MPLEEKDEPEPVKNPCPANAERSCCWHQAMVNNFRSGDTGQMEVTERCCFCDRGRTLTYSLAKDPTHGPFAPRGWTLTLPS